MVVTDGLWLLFYSISQFAVVAKVDSLLLFANQPNRASTKICLKEWIEVAETRNLILLLGNWFGTITNFHRLNWKLNCGSRKWLPLTISNLAKQKVVKESLLSRIKVRSHPRPAKIYSRNGCIVHFRSIKCVLYLLIIATVLKIILSKTCLFIFLWRFCNFSWFELFELLKSFIASHAMELLFEHSLLSDWFGHKISWTDTAVHTKYMRKKIIRLN